MCPEFSSKSPRPKHLTPTPLLIFPKHLKTIGHWPPPAREHLWANQLTPQVRTWHQASGVSGAHGGTRYYCVVVTRIRTALRVHLSSLHKDKATKDSKAWRTARWPLPLPLRYVLVYDVLHGGWDVQFPQLMKSRLTAKFVEVPRGIKFGQMYREKRLTLNIFFRDRAL